MKDIYIWFDFILQSEEIYQHFKRARIFSPIIEAPFPIQLGFVDAN